MDSALIVFAAVLIVFAAGVLIVFAGAAVCCCIDCVCCWMLLHPELIVPFLPPPSSIEGNHYSGSTAVSHHLWLSEDRGKPIADIPLSVNSSKSQMLQFETKITTCGSVRTEVPR